MSSRTAFLAGSAFCLVLSLIVYLTREQLAVMHIAQGRFILAHPWILTFGSILICLGLIVYGLLNMVKIPNKGSYLPSVVTGVILLLCSPSIIRNMLQRLEHEVQNPDIVRHIYENTAKALAGISVLLVLASVAARRR